MANVEVGSEELQKAVDEALRDKADEIFAKSQDNIIDMDLVNSSFLLKSGNVLRVAPLHYRITYSAPHAAPIEFGTVPHMPPVDAIEAWVRSKLKVSESQNPRRIAWAIATQIAKNGTFPRSYLQSAADFVRLTT